MSFAVIQTGGKQYKVAVGDEIAVEKLAGDLKVGDKVLFSPFSGKKLEFMLET